MVTRSLWLPVNFYSAMTDPELLVQESGVLSGQCRSTRHEDRPDYIPFLRESVLRRLVEVLPSSFGYERVGRCQFSNDRDDKSRPVSLTMTLRPTSSEPGLAAAMPANQALRDAGVAEVTLRVDEMGFYAFAASHDGSGEGTAVADALVAHILTVFGGDFRVNRLEPSTDRRGREGMEAVLRYNGLGGEPSPPLGALSFQQLNVMVEGLCNQSLLPSVFFEHYQDAKEWLDENRQNSSILTYLDDFIRAVTVDADAATEAGQITTLHRFMTISRGSLQWMRRSVESVRRSLLDQMMAVSHRQARLIQVDLAGIGYERTPELTGEATESQMRGYVMLMATKLPLMFTIADGARDAVTTLTQRAGRDEEAELTQVRMAELETLVASWAALLDRLRINVASLETAVEHDWQERLLYEQEQARSEQEAMAEIERSRRGRPESRRLGDAAYNASMLLLTAVAVFIAVRTGEETKATGWQQIFELWPFLAVLGGFMIVWQIVATVARWRRQRNPNSDAYSFESALRVDEPADPQRIRNYLLRRQSDEVESRAFKKVKLRRLGGWRVERISGDTTLLKVHSIAVVRLTLLRYARVEIVTEIMARKISTNYQFFVRQCRMFGDSPVPIPLDQLADLFRELLEHTCAELAIEFDVSAMTDPIDLLRSP